MKKIVMNKPKMFLGETILIDFSLGFSFEHKEAPHVALTNKQSTMQK